MVSLLFNLIHGVTTVSCVRQPDSIWNREALRRFIVGPAVFKKTQMVICFKKFDSQVRFIL